MVIKFLEYDFKFTTESPEKKFALSINYPVNPIILLFFSLCSLW